MLQILHPFRLETRNNGSGSNGESSKQNWGTGLQRRSKNTVAEPWRTRAHAWRLSAELQTVADAKPCTGPEGSRPNIRSASAGSILGHFLTSTGSLEPLARPPSSTLRLRLKMPQNAQRQRQRIDHICVRHHTVIDETSERTNRWQMMGLPEASCGCKRARELALSESRDRGVRGLNLNQVEKRAAEVGGKRKREGSSYLAMNVSSFTDERKSE